MRPARISRAQVLDATLDLAAEAGLGAVTMRAVAARLEVTPMALYRHVGDKQGLLDGLVERLMAQLTVPAAATSSDAAVETALGADPDWRATLRGLALSIRAVARRYPDLFPLLFQRRAVTEGAQAPRQAVFAALRAAGVPEPELASAERMLSTFVYGFAASEAGGRFAGLDIESEFEYAAKHVERLIEAIAAGAS
ncbi:TetR/AcrR family transcriptional regulator C-terminal domain-containing protein [Actinospica durhamensis]|uniref:TetR/AcrR family transcriptional regulator C-terminal domain-containing protein n=1 Tax=Actinospica durhamensis TaxID=1508375 RepID=A0A941ESF0_9ACTN|nr:TetR/AcrR family transcriptional regulator C-terminal domain-containing protein [Actinospica durhamensis]MBR7836318.1 TetR/AcrR family transcriptional regulator C-terminal domain-containing protein [Actinospica durhamensis]